MNQTQKKREKLVTYFCCSLVYLKFLASLVMSLLRLQPINGISQLSPFPHKKRPLLLRPQALPSRTQVPNLQSLMPPSAFFVTSPNNTYSVKFLHSLLLLIEYDKLVSF